MNPNPVPWSSYHLGYHAYATTPLLWPSYPLVWSLMFTICPLKKKRFIMMRFIIPSLSNTIFNNFIFMVINLISLLKSDSNKNLQLFYRSVSIPFSFPGILHVCVCVYIYIARDLFVNDFLLRNFLIDD